MKGRPKIRMTAPATKEARAHFASEAEIGRGDQEVGRYHKSLTI